MMRSKRIHPMQVAIFIILLVLLPLGMLTLTAVLGASPLPWLSTGHGRDAADADQSVAEPASGSASAPDEQMLRAGYVASVPTPELIFLPLVSQ